MASCTFLKARGLCSSVDIQAECPSHCTPRKYFTVFIIAVA